MINENLGIWPLLTPTAHPIRVGSGSGQWEWAVGVGSGSGQWEWAVGVGMRMGVTLPTNDYFQNGKVAIGSVRTVKFAHSLFPLPSL